MWTNQIGWWIVTDLPGEHGNGLRNCFSTWQIWPSSMPSCFIKRGGKMTHKRFREVLVRNLITESHEQTVTASGASRGRPSPSVSQISCLEVKHSQQWKRRCRVCAMKNKWGSTLFFCAKCDVGLCIVDCFERWHTHVNVWMNSVSYQAQHKDNSVWDVQPVKKPFLCSLLCE